MRIDIAAAPYVAILSTTLVFLVSVPEESRASPSAVVSTAITVLLPFIDNYLGDMRARRETEKIEVKVWMHTGDRNMNGCGFYFEVTGHSGNSEHDWFPREVVHSCGREDYRMRMTSQSAMYNKLLRLGNDQAKEIQVHADGWRDTFVKTMCFGLNERTIAGGPRAFCIDNNLLKSCKQLTNKWNDINLNSDNIMKFTRTMRGIHIIKFTDVENLIIGFESLAGNSDDEDAVQKICERIELVRGGFADSIQDCRADIRTYGNGLYSGYNPRFNRQDKNPDGCNRYPGNK